MFYCMLQEGINNIFWYVYVQFVLFQILLYGDQLMFILEDDGWGFKLAEYSLVEILGLKGFYLCVQFLQGMLDVDSVFWEGIIIIF